MSSITTLAPGASTSTYAAGQSSSKLKAALVVLGLASVTAVLMAVLDTGLFWQVIGTAVVGGFFFVVLWVSMTTSVSGLLRPRNVVFALWWMLVLSEEVFSYMADVNTTFEGQFAAGAYSEAAIWVFCLLGLIAYSLRNAQFLYEMFKGPYKWVTLFAIVALLSCSYSVNVFFATAWCCKLWVAVLILGACKHEIRTVDDVRAFLKVSMWGFFFLVVLPFSRLIADPSVMASGRLFDIALAPTNLSAVAGILVMLSLTVYAPGHRFVPVFFALFGSIMMILAGGKAGIVAGIITGILFFVLQKKFAGLGMDVIIMLVVGVTILTTTPLGTYLKFYAETNQVTTVTGRTDVWGGGLKLIVKRPIFGYGYMSSRFLPFSVPGIVWQPEHLHDGFLEVQYNNGIFGLFIILMMHYWIIKNLWIAMKYSRVGTELNQLAVGCLVVYLNVLFNGLVSRAFGSRADATFVMMFALVFFGELLKNIALNASAARKKAAVRIGSLNPQVATS